MAKLIQKLPYCTGEQVGQSCAEGRHGPKVVRTRGGVGLSTHHAECGCTERVARSKLPDSGNCLRNAACSNSWGDDEVGLADTARADVEHGEDEGRGGEGGKPQGSWGAELPVVDGERRLRGVDGMPSS